MAIDCKGRVTRCGAKSTCGKPAFVTRQIPVSACENGFCANDPATTCLTDLDCGATCRVKSSDVRCLDVGGVVGLATSCCAGPNCAP